MPVQVTVASFTLPDQRFHNLATEADSLGYKFVNKFQHRWKHNLSRYDRDGEKLLEISNGNTIVAFGSLCIDPYADDPSIGRVRHIYVMSAFRKLGYGRLLLETLLEGPHPFSRIRLRAGDETASAFYDSIGWVRSNDEDATHEAPL